MDIDKEYRKLAEDIARLPDQQRGLVIKFILRFDVLRRAGRQDQIQEMLESGYRKRRLDWPPPY